MVGLPPTDRNRPISTDQLRTAFRVGGRRRAISAPPHAAHAAAHRPRRLPSNRPCRSTLSGSGVLVSPDLCPNDRTICMRTMAHLCPTDGNNCTRTFVSLVRISTLLIVRAGCMTCICADDFRGSNGQATYTYRTPRIRRAVGRERALRGCDGAARSHPSEPDRSGEPCR